MKSLLIATAIFASAVGPVDAQSMDSMTAAMELGSALASEEPCGLTYNQERIADWIEENVSADDMGFAGSLDMMASGSAMQIEGMGPSQKTAHCTQIRRVARSYGFTD